MYLVPVERENMIRGDKIKKLRLRLDMSQERFAKKLGISGKSVSAYENGKCEPPLRVLERITDVYDLNFVSLKEDKRNALVEKITQVKAIIEELEDKLLR